MSTKTSIKRIAAVAAVALTLGGFSAVTAHAGPTPVIGTASGGTSTSGSTATAAVAKATVNAYVVDTFTAGANDKVYTLSSSGVGTLFVAASGAVTGGTTTYSTNASNVTTWYGGTTTPGATAFAGTEYMTFSASSSVAGTQVITATSDAGNSVSLTITWGAAPTVSAQYSTVWGAASTTLASSAESSALSATKGVTTGAAQSIAASYNINLNSAASTPILNQGISVAITSGPGTLGLVQANSGTTATAVASSGGTGATVNAPSAGRSLSISAANGNLSQFVAALYPDGTAGTTTITFTSGTVVIATKTFTFTGSASSVKASQNLTVLKAGGTAGVAAGNVYNGAVTINDAQSVLSSSKTVSGVASAYAGYTPITAFTYDSNGSKVTLTDFTSSSIKLVVGDSSIVTAGSCQQAAYDTGLGASGDVASNEINCYVTGTVGAASGASTTVTVALYNGTTKAFDILSAPMTFTIGGSIAKEVLSSDATSYASAAPVKLTWTATDSAGNPVYDQDLNNGLITLGSLTSSSYLGGTLAYPSALVGGKATKTVYAPASAGTVVISGTDHTSAAAAISTSFSVTSPSSDAAQAAVDAANEATDAANAATDAANNAMDSADAAQQAALDAGDKADAALAAVTDLATKVSDIAAQIASLSALVKKIAAKVKA